LIIENFCSLRILFSPKDPACRREERREKGEGRREKGEGDKKHVHITIRGRKHIRRGSFT
jgi:hypothetical protein